jgi:hypothetical protein
MAPAKRQRRHMRGWYQGAAWVVAEVYRFDGGRSTLFDELERAIGLSLEECRANGVDKYDLEDLKRAGIPNRAPRAKARRGKAAR